MAATSSLHIAMYPWFAFGHLTPYLQVANKLAKKGHHISFFIPTKTQSKLQPFNHFPELIIFIPIVVTHVDGLPLGAETTADVPHDSQFSLIMTAMDRTELEVEHLLQDIKPDVVFFDFACWIPKLARQLGQLCGHDLTEADFMQPPAGFPSSTIKLHVHEVRFYKVLTSSTFGSDILFFDRHFTGLIECDAIAFKSCREIEGCFIGYLESEFKKPVLLSGSVELQQPKATLDEKWANWLARFDVGSVIFCAFGSECTLEKDQFQELLSGFELSNMPFFAALKPPLGANTVEAAMPEGFEERVGGRGVVYGGWVPQQLILDHPSIGCFVTHCGSASLSEALPRRCQLVLLPHAGDHFFRARTMRSVLKVGVEVERGEEDGHFTRESVCKAVMDEENEMAKEIRANRGKIRELLIDKDLQESYINSFIHGLQALVA